jgi:cobalt/nickel transport system permease protein
MHIPDGVLSGPVLGATAALAAGGVALGLARLDAERVPRVGVAASVFLVASLIHVPIGPASVHLVLTGLIGLLLGWAAFPALAVALLLQAVLFGFGGVTALGANVLDMALPAVVCALLFRPALRRSSGRPSAFAWGVAAGATGVVLGYGMLAAVLLASGKGFGGFVAALSVGHLALLAVEGFVTGAAVAFLARVRPGLLAMHPRACGGEESRCGA